MHWCVEEGEILIMGENFLNDSTDVNVSGMNVLHQLVE